MIIAEFKSGETKCYTKTAHQFDKGQKLTITGATLPEAFEVHISNEREGTIAYSGRGTAGEIAIPDVFFVSGEYVYVWIYSVAVDEPNTAEEGETVCSIVIPVERRPAYLPVTGAQESQSET